jgi:Flp pilus assembly protein TadD
MRNFLLAAAIGVLAVRPASAASNTAEADLAHNAGRTYLADGRAELAIEQFRKAISLDDKNYFAYKGLGIAYAQLKNFKEAEKAQRKCLEINPDFADARNDLGATLMLLGRAEEARKEWQSAYASPFNPTPDQTATNLGNSFLEAKNYPEATQWYRAAIQRNEGYSPAHVGLAMALMATNKVDDAIKDLEKAAAKVTGDPELLYTLGDAYYRVGRFTDARTKLDAVLKMDPVGPWGRRSTEKLKHFPK